MNAKRETPFSIRTFDVGILRQKKRRIFPVFGSINTGAEFEQKRRDLVRPDLTGPDRELLIPAFFFRRSRIISNVPFSERLSKRREMFTRGKK